MNMYKRLVASLLAGILCLCLCACGAQEHAELIGTWGNESEANGVRYYNEFVLNPDGTFTKKDYKNGTLIQSPSGNYEVDGDTLILYVDATTRIKYTFNDGKLYNGTRAYEKQ